MKIHRQHYQIRSVTHRNTLDTMLNLNFDQTYYIRWKISSLLFHSKSISKYVIWFQYCCFSPVVNNNWPNETEISESIAITSHTQTKTYISRRTRAFHRIHTNIIIQFRLKISTDFINANEEFSKQTD